MKNRITKRWLAIAAIGAMGLAACDQNPVELPEAASVTVSPASMTLYAGESAVVTAQVLDQDGQVLRGAEAAWSSSAPAVAAVVGGRVVAMAPGTATLEAAYGQNRGTVEVTVREDTDRAASVDVLEESVELHLAAGYQYLSYRVVDERGRTNCFGETAAEVTSSDPAIVEAGLSGGCQIWVEARFNGTATVTLTVDGVSDSFDVAVVSDQYAAVWSEVASNTDLVAGNTVEYTVRVLDQNNEGVEGQTVNFAVDLGRLESTSVVTDADGYATASWVLPEVLGESSPYQDWDFGTISFRAALPSGQTGGSRNVAINAAEIADFVLYQYDADAAEWVELDGTEVLAETGTQVRLAAVAFDAFGNQRDYWAVGFSAEPAEEDFTTILTGYDFVADGAYYARVAGYTSSSAQSATVTVFDATLDNTLDDEDFAETIVVTWADPAPAS